jgi:transcriptional/translational regulatory protein YebC/TACO1
MGTARALACSGGRLARRIGADFYKTAIFLRCAPNRSPRSFRLFNRKGPLIVSRDAAKEDDLMELALEAGAADFVAEPEDYEILTKPGYFEKVYRQVEVKKIKLEAAHATWLPTLTVPIHGKEAAEVHAMLDQLEEDDDVKEVYHNAEFAGES